MAVPTRYVAPFLPPQQATPTLQTNRPQGSPHNNQQQPRNVYNQATNGIGPPGPNQFSSGASDPRMDNFRLFQNKSMGGPPMHPSMPQGYSIPQMRGPGPGAPYAWPAAKGQMPPSAPGSSPYPRPESLNGPGVNSHVFHPSQQLNAPHRGVGIAADSDEASQQRSGELDSPSRLGISTAVPNSRPAAESVDTAPFQTSLSSTRGITDSLRQSPHIQPTASPQYQTPQSQSRNTYQGMQPQPATAPPSAQSPPSSIATPGSGVYPLLAESRDSIQVQVHAQQPRTFPPQGAPQQTPSLQPNQMHALRDIGLRQQQQQSLQDPSPVRQPYRPQIPHPDALNNNGGMPHPDQGGLPQQGVHASSEQHGDTSTLSSSSQPPRSPHAFEKHDAQFQTTPTGPQNPLQPPPPLFNSVIPSNQQRAGAPPMPGHSQALAIPRQIASMSLRPGGATLRLMEFCSGISNFKAANSDVQWWQHFVQSYINPGGIFEITLWRVSESRKFFLNEAILGRFFHRTFSCGVKSIKLSFHTPREGLAADGRGTCLRVEASWTYNYHSGYVVTLHGPLEVNLQGGAPPALPPGYRGPAYNPVWRFSSLRFAAATIDKFIAVEAIEGVRSSGEAGIGYENMPREGDSPGAKGTPNGSSRIVGGLGDPANESSWINIQKAKLPPDPVNDFGIPQSLLRCLDLSDSVGSLSELFKYSWLNSAGPIESLNRVAETVRQKNPELAEAFQGRTHIVGATVQPSDAHFGQRQNTIVSESPHPANVTPKIAQAIQAKPQPSPDRFSSAQRGVKREDHKSPKVTAPPLPSSASDSSNLSSPPTASTKRKAAAMEEVEPSSSAADPAPASGRRGRVMPSPDTAPSTRASRLRKAPSPKPVSKRSRRRG